MKDKKKTKTIPRQVRWDKLDNTAHLFPSIAGESMTNVYRISVTLKEEVQVEFLQQALDMILPKFDGFIFGCAQAYSGIILKRTEKRRRKSRKRRCFHAGLSGRTKTAIICSV